MVVYAYHVAGNFLGFKFMQKVPWAYFVDFVFTKALINFWELAGVSPLDRHG